MSSEDNKELVRQYFETFQSGDGAIYDQILAPGFGVRRLRDNLSQIPPEQKGPEAFKKLLPSFRTAFPDGTITIDEMVSEGNQVIAAWTFQGTHQGEFLGVPPSHKPISYVGVNGFHITDGKLSEGWDLQDSLNLFQQLNLLPNLAKILARTGD